MNNSHATSGGSSSPPSLSRTSRSARRSLTGHHRRADLGIVDGDVRSVVATEAWPSSICTARRLRVPRG